MPQYEDTDFVPDVQLGAAAIQVPDAVTGTPAATAPLPLAAAITAVPQFQVGVGAPYVAAVDGSSGTEVRVMPPQAISVAASFPRLATLWLPPLFPQAELVYGAYKAKKDGRIRIGPFIRNGGGPVSPPRKKGDPDPPPLPPNGDFKNPGGFKTKEEADEWNEKRWKYIIGRWDNFFADYTLTCTFTYNDKPVATGVDISAAFSTNKEPQKDPKSGKSGNHPSGGIDASKLQDALAAAKKPPPEWNDIESLVFKKKDGGGGGGGDIPVVDDAKEPVKFVFPGHKDKDGKDDYDKAKDNPNDKGSPDDPDPAGRPPK